MKIKHIFTSLIASLALLVGCEESLERHLDEVQVSQSYIALDKAGADLKVTVKASAEWQFEGLPEWLSAKPASGGAGETEVVFSAGAAEATREASFYLTCAGAQQQMLALQMCEKVELPLTSCADIKSSAEVGKMYRVRGTVTSLGDFAKYGAFFVNDGTASSPVQIYNSAESERGKDLGVGDEVEFEGKWSSYGNFEGVIILKIVKSLIKVDAVTPEDAALPLEGGQFVVTLTCKGNGVKVVLPEAIQSWVSVAGIETSGSTAVVTLNVAANAGGDRSAELTFETTSGGKTYTATTSFSQKGAIIDATAAEINAAEDGDTQYRVTGYVSSIASDVYGNLYLKDATGEVYIYGVLDAEGNTKNFASLGIKAGDIITVVGPKTSYKDAPQMKNVSVEAIKSVETVTVAQFLAKEDSKDVYYSITGKVANIKSTTYGNFDIVDESGSVYVYGLTNGWGGASKQFESFNIKEGDQLTILGVRTSYKDTPQVGSAFYVDHQVAGDEVVSQGIEFLLDSSLGVENGTEVTTLTKDGITLAFDKGTGNNAPKYYTTGNAVRVYGGGTVTISGAQMSQIKVTFASGEGSNEITANTGTYADGVWQGDAESVVLTIGGTSGHRRFAKIEVTKK